MAAAPPPPVFNDGGAALLAELAAAARDGVRKLDLGGRGLTALPPEIGTLTSLEELNCADNLLDDLPDALEGCSSLRVLFFLRCRFTRVPRVVGRLPSLFMLSFKSNLLEEVGEDALPPSLGWLILTDNRLRALPASLGRLPLLRKLMLASNALGDLPDLRGLRALELLRVSDNRLGGGALCALHALPRLAWLAVAGNDAPPVRAGDALAVLSRAGAPRLRMSDVRVGAVLGEGASGVVYAAALLAGGEGGAARVGGAEGAGGEQPVALKVFKAASSDGRPIDEVRALGWNGGERLTVPCCIGCACTRLTVTAPLPGCRCSPAIAAPKPRQPPRLCCRGQRPGRHTRSPGHGAAAGHWLCGACAAALVCIRDARRVSPRRAARAAAARAGRGRCARRGRSMRAHARARRRAW